MLIGMERVYIQASVREGPVPLQSKIFQGFGSMTDSHIQFAFNALLMIYYNQLLGVPATSLSLVLVAGLIIDAISDPLVGAFSDRLNSRFGRRHLLMYISALPLGIMMFFLFSPPAFLSESQLVGWLLVSVIGLRLAFTLFHVPWVALGMELSVDYYERTEIIGWRLVSGWIGGVAFSFGMYTYVFGASDAFPQGQLNPNSYPVFGVVAGSLVALWCFLTAHLTRKELPYLATPAEPTNLSVEVMFKQIWSVVLNPYYRKLVIALLFLAVVSSFGGFFDALMNTFFWGLAGEDLRWFSVAILGAAFGIFLAVRLSRHYQKQHIIVAALLANMILAIIKVSLRFLDWVPENGDPMLVWVLATQEVLHVIVVTMPMTLIPSMLADLSDDQEQRSGERQEGVLASITSFAMKLTSSVGLIAGGLMLDYFIEMPAGAAKAGIAIESDVLFRLAISDGIISSLLLLIPISILATYKMSRSDIEEIQTHNRDKRRTIPGA
jgi:GPH family glycoside/pentoside/hexuronide:cation symporter